MQCCGSSKCSALNRLNAPTPDLLDAPALNLLKRHAASSPLPPRAQRVAGRGRGWGGVGILIGRRTRESVYVEVEFIIDRARRASPRSARHAQIARRANLSRRAISDFQKLSCLRPQISGFLRIVPPRSEGRVAIVTKRGAGCDGRDGAETTSGAGTDGEVVWSWCPDAGIKSADDDPPMTGARKPGPRGDYEGNR
jgi:hypothetical protein